MNFRQIVFPVDFSDRSASAAKYVAGTAQLFQSRIALVHAVEDPLKWYGSPDPIKVVEIDVPKLISESEGKLRQFADSRLPGADVTISAEIAGPLELIERTSQSLDADLIMMSTHGRGRFRSLLLGSVTGKVLHDLTTPVWTDAHLQSSEFHWPMKRIACAVDLGTESANVLRFATDFGRHCGAEVFLVHGVPAPEMRLGAYNKIEPPTYMEDFARSEIARIQSEAGTSVDVFIERGPISSVVKNAAIQRQADLIVIGRGAISHAADALFAHAYAVIHESPCPVLSL